MVDILIRASVFVGIIILAYFLRRISFFKEEDFQVVSKILINITITATIIVNFSGRTLDTGLLIFAIIGFVSFGPLLMLVYYLTSRKKDKESQALSICCACGCNIGGFALPFVQTFLGAEAVMALSIFDCGNSFTTMGGAYSVASAVKKGGNEFNFGSIFKKVIKSVPIIAYLFMILLSLLKLKLPVFIVEYASVIANANTFLAMMMIGMGFHLDGSKKQISELVRILSIRYLFAIILSVLTYFIIPIPENWKKVLVIMFLSPVSGAAPAYTAKLKSDYGFASALNSFSIIISIILITLFLILSN